MVSRDLEKQLQAALSAIAKPLERVDLVVTYLDKENKAVDPHNLWRMLSASVKIDGHNCGWCVRTQPPRGGDEDATIALLVQELAVEISDNPEPRENTTFTSCRIV